MLEPVSPLQPLDRYERTRSVCGCGQEIEKRADENMVHHVRSLPKPGLQLANAGVGVGLQKREVVDGLLDGEQVR